MKVWAAVFVDDDKQLSGVRMFTLEAWACCIAAASSLACLVCAADSCT